MRRLLAWSILLLPALAGAQGFDLAIRNIMGGPEVYGREPTTAASEARNGIVPNYVTSGGCTEDIPNRTKVGDAQPATRIGFQTLPRGDVVWLKTIDGETAIANSAIAAWNDAGTRALLIGSGRNFKTRQLSVLDVTSGAIKSIDVLTDTAWVGGPCGLGCAGFSNDDQRVYRVGEATGYAQLWSAALDGSDKKQLTSGNFEIYDVRLSNDRRSFLFHSSVPRVRCPHRSPSHRQPTSSRTAGRILRS